MFTIACYLDGKYRRSDLLYVNVVQQFQTEQLRGAGYKHTQMNLADNRLSLRLSAHSNRMCGVCLMWDKFSHSVQPPHFKYQRD